MNRRDALKTLMGLGAAALVGCDERKDEGAILTHQPQDIPMPKWAKKAEKLRVAKRKERKERERQAAHTYLMVKSAQSQHLEKTLKPILEAEVAKVERNPDYMRTVVKNLEQGKWQMGESVVDMLKKGKSVQVVNYRGKTETITPEQYRNLGRLMPTYRKKLEEHARNSRVDYVFGEFVGLDQRAEMVRSAYEGGWSVFHMFTEDAQYNCEDARNNLFEQFSEECHPMDGLYGVVEFVGKQREEAIQERRDVAKGMLNLRDRLTQIGGLAKERWFCQRGPDALYQAARTK